MGLGVEDTSISPWWGFCRICAGAQEIAIAFNAATGDEVRFCKMLYAKKIAQGKGVVIPEDAKLKSAAMSAWIDSNRGTKRGRHGRKTAYKLAATKRSRKRKAYAAAAPPAPAQPNSVTGTPLRIPYGNKQVALKLGSRYRSGGWYAPPGVDLSAIRRARMAVTLGV